MKNLIIIGSGGHATACIDVVQSKKEYKILGFVDNKENLIQKNLKFKILCNDSDLPFIRKKADNAIIGIGQIKDYKLRYKIFNKLLKYKFNLPIISSKFSYISKSSKIDIGTIIMHNVMINCNVSIGYNCIINSGSIIEHDVIIENNCHIAPGAIINGGVKIKSGTFIGSGVVIKHGVTIGKNCIISASKFIDNSIPNDKTYK